MQSGRDRRDFIKRSLSSRAPRGPDLRVGAARAYAQTSARAGAAGGPLRGFVHIFERKPFKWPQGTKRWRFGSPPTSRSGTTIPPVGTGVSPNVANIVPDVINYAWREYGMRVGLWRIADTLDAAGVKATVALNSRCAKPIPKALDEMKKRGWEFMGHGTTNSENLAGLNPEKDES